MRDVGKTYRGLHCHFVFFLALCVVCLGSSCSLDMDSPILSIFGVFCHEIFPSSMWHNSTAWLALAGFHPKFWASSMRSDIYSNMAFVVVVSGYSLIICAKPDNH